MARTFKDKPGGHTQHPLNAGILLSKDGTGVLSYFWYEVESQRGRKWAKTRLARARRRADSLLVRKNLEEMHEDQYHDLQEMCLEEEQAEYESWKNRHEADELSCYDEYECRDRDYYSDFCGCAVCTEGVRYPDWEDDEWEAGNRAWEAAVAYQEMSQQQVNETMYLPHPEDAWSFLDHEHTYPPEHDAECVLQGYTQGSDRARNTILHDHGAWQECTLDCMTVEEAFIQRSEVL